MHIHSLHPSNIIYIICIGTFLQLNTGQTGTLNTGNDLNVEPAWIQGITGCNSIVAIVDDGMFLAGTKYVCDIFGVCRD